MKNNLSMKLGLIAAVTILAIWAFVPPSQKVKLGLDLRGGVHLVLGVQTDDAIRLETETSSEQLKQALADSKITVTTAPSLSEFTVSGVPPAQDQQFRTIADQQVGLRFTREPGTEGSYVFRMRPNVMVETRDGRALQSAVDFGRPDPVAEMRSVRPKFAALVAPRLDAIVTGVAA